MGDKMKKVLVVGGSVIDIFAYPKEKLILGDSNPGYLKRSLGGVGRNIAENLARLEVDTTLFTVLGKDEGRRWIMTSAQNARLKLSAITVEQTPSYISIQNEENDQVVSIALMDEIEKIDIDDIKKRDNIFIKSDIIVLETNLRQDVMEYIARTYQDKSIYVDVISCQKADKIKTIFPFIQTLKMNLVEAKYLSGLDENITDEKLGKYFISKGVKEVYITKGNEGSIYVSPNEIKQIKTHVIEVKNTAGAGDAYFAGVIYANINQLDPLNYGTKAALLTLKDEKAVSEEMSLENLEKIDISQ
jgi:pseudouridine kinase